MDSHKKDKFKSNPYNSLNKLVSKNDITNILKNININDFKLNNIQLYQTAFVHKSYCHMKDYEEFENDIKAFMNNNAKVLGEIIKQNGEVLRKIIMGYNKKAIKEI